MGIINTTANKEAKFEYITLVRVSGSGGKSEGETLGFSKSLEMITVKYKTPSKLTYIFRFSAIDLSRKLKVFIKKK
jgi:hypothetical protein